MPVPVPPHKTQFTSPTPTRQDGESVALLLVARRTNNQPMIGRLRIRGLLKYCVSQCRQVTALGELSAVVGRHSFFRAVGSLDCQC